MNDSSPDCRNWTNAKLMAEAFRLSSFADFGSYFRDEPVIFGVQQDCGDWIRETTRIYRETWLEPVLEEIERRFVRAKR